MTRGFSLVEVLVSMALLVTLMAGVVGLVVSGQRIARVQPEIADQQQRARMAVQALSQDISHAGAGLDTGERAGSLQRFFGSLVPSLDGGVTVWYVSAREAQAALAASAGPGSSLLTLASTTVCPAPQFACAFAPSTTGILFDSTGCHDVVRIDATGAATLQLHTPPNGCPYSPGASIAQGEVRTYRIDPLARQLFRRDESTGIDAPVLDGIDAMTIEYYGDTTAAYPAPLDPALDPRGVRRVRITLRFAPNARDAGADLVVSFDVTPPNLRQG
jgi:prepilin-type N-terminal cleavage/methylation domain-containing protein